MKKIIKQLDWLFDYHIGYTMYNYKKLHRYHEYMYTKWGNRYCSQEEYEKYIDSVSRVS